MLALGDEVEVRVDDIDQNGKLSLSLVGDGPDEGGARPEGAEAAGAGDRPRGDRGERSSRSEHEDSGAPAEHVSFEDFWERQAREEFGDLGPADEPPPAPVGGGERRGARSPARRSPAGRRPRSRRAGRLGRLSRTGSSR
ncbi:MAG: hypothetical protein KatS3mg010_1903 [Acidimicrobiia bacterium]|nr:MAG: hypothetical protein KatS3mg010_1903 [Acidimicrobiia bacterium]